MKTLKKLVLNQLSREDLNEKEMKQIVGGQCWCGCGCLYQYSGGSATAVNMIANAQTGSSSSSYQDRVSCDATGYWSKGVFYWEADIYSYNGSGEPWDD